MKQPTPSLSAILDATSRTAATLSEALEASALGGAGFNFYSGRGQLLESLSYRQLLEAARAGAQRLLNTGLSPGQTVGVVASTDPEFVKVFFACQFAGLVPAPLPLPTAMGGRQHYLEHLRRMLISCEAAAAFAPDSLCEWIEQACSSLPMTYVGAYAKLPERSGQAIHLPQQSPEALAYLQFSSGSTRFPRGVAVTQRAVMANTRSIKRDGLRADERDRCVSWLPMYHDMGLVGFMLTPLVTGITVDYLPTHEFARRPMVWLDLISRNGGTLSYSPSFGYELCVRRATRSIPPGLDLSRWRVAGIGGDMIRPKVLRRFAETFAPCGFDPRSCVASYGMAEASLALSFAPLGAGLRADRIDAERLEHEHVAFPPAADKATGRTREFVHCGPILPGHEVEVRNDRGQALSQRHVGVIYVRGPSLMREYYGEPEETARVLSTDGWLNTGDLGYLYEGEVVITGRAKDLIMLNGRNIWPQDLEWTIEAEVDDIRSGGVAAFAVEGEPADEVVILFECRRSDTEARNTLCQQVRGVLKSRHGVEVQVIPVPPRALPQTSSGKLSRAKARQLYLGGQFTDVADAAAA